MSKQLIVDKLMIKLSSKEFYYPKWEWFTTDKMA